MAVLPVHAGGQPFLNCRPVRFDQSRWGIPAGIMRKKPSLSPSGGFFVETSDALSFAGILSPPFWVFDSMWRVDVATGTVKWFNSTKGYGFIQPDNGGKDVFVHISAVEKAGFSSLAEGAKVSYEIVSDRGKESAGNLRL